MECQIIGFEFADDPTMKSYTTKNNEVIKKWAIIRGGWVGSFKPHGLLNIVGCTCTI
jgi:hypothetical protein